MLPEWLADETPGARVVAAWFVLDCLSIERVPWWAAQWLAGGQDGPVLQELAGLGGDDPRAVRDLLPAALGELGVVLPDAAVAAASVWFDHVAAMCLAGRAAERWVAQVVDDVVRACDFDEGVLELPLGKLYGVADAWSECWGPDEDGLRAMVKTACLTQVGDRSFP